MSPVWPGSASLHCGQSSKILVLQEVNGLRNRYLDTYLPPRRKQNRIASEPERKTIKLQYAHQPITDLSIPTTEQ